MLENAKVGLAYDAFFDAFRNYIPRLKLVENTEDVKNYDLVIFSGGVDVGPSRYNSKVTYAQEINPVRDSIEFSILSECNRLWGRASVNRRPRVLGVCRGHQLVNVYFGSKLVQDLGIELGEAHSGSHGYDVLTEDTPMPTLFPNGVNSYHHQGVLMPGMGLRATTRYKKIVESTEGDGVFTVQCHPEMMGEYGIPFFEYVEKWVYSLPKKKEESVEEMNKPRNRYYTMPSRLFVQHEEVANAPVQAQRFFQALDLQAPDELIADNREEPAFFGEWNEPEEGDEEEEEEEI